MGDDGWNDYAGLWIDSDAFLDNDVDYVANRERAHDKQKRVSNMCVFLKLGSEQVRTTYLVTMNVLFNLYRSTLSGTSQVCCKWNVVIK